MIVFIFQVLLKLYIYKKKEMKCKQTKQIKLDYQYFKNHPYLYSEEEKIIFLKNLKNNLDALIS
jgi:hypothetical protein